MILPNAGSLFYRYVLGELTDEERREVEERLVTDDDCRWRLFAAECELIAAYISGYLALDIREKLEKHFFGSAENIEKLDLARLLYDEARANTPTCPDLNALAYRYFLGEVSPAEQARIETEMANDDNLKKEVQAAYRVLVVAYTLEEPTGNRRKKVQPYFFGSEERLEKLKFAEAMRDCLIDIELAKAQEGASSGSFNRLRQWLKEPVNISMSRPIWQPLAAVSICILGALIWVALFYKSPITKSLNDLYAAYAQGRPVEGRLTGFGYATYRAEQSGQIVAPDRRKRDKAFGVIIGLADEDGTPAAYHALGTIYLTDKDFNEAVRYFNLALRQNADDAKLHNDLAVALMEREKAKNAGQSTGEDTALALAHLRRAIELNGSLPEAHFNLALCHQSQMLWRREVEDWKRYLENDSASPWAEEARRNLARVTEKIQQAGGNRENIYQNFLKAYREHDVEQAWAMYKQSRVNASSFITNRLIDNFVSLALTGKSAEAEENLSALLFIGNLEMERVQDRFGHDLAHFYRGAAPQQLRKLSNARSLVRDANERLRQSRVAEAISHYQQAIELFDQAGDICESLLARRWLGHCYFRQASAQLSLPMLERGQKECETRGYLWPLSLYLNDLANVNAALSKYSTALDYGLSQINHARNIQDDYGVLLGANRVTEARILLARYQDALPQIQEGLLTAKTINAEPGQIIGLYLFASKSYMASGKFPAALDYAKEAYDLSREIKNPWVTSRHQVHLALAHHKLDNHAEAIRLIRESEDIGRRLQDEKMGREIMAFAHLHLGEVYREAGDLDNAVKSYGAALQLYDGRDINIHWLRLQARKGILLTQIKRGDHAAVEEELKQVIDLYEESRQNIEDESSRNSFFDNEQGVYDIATGYTYFKRHNPRRAFDFSEMSRARSILKAIKLPSEKLLGEKLPSVSLQSSTRPLDLGEIQGRLPGKTQLLQYSVLENHLIIWVVSGADLKSHYVEIGREALDNKVDDYLRTLTGGRYTNQGDEHKSRSADLYNLLIKPIERLLDKDVEVCIVPDKALSRLPFASLISPTTGKYLIEERVIVISPSANMFVAATERARQKESLKAERLLSIGNPLFDKAAFRDLKDLPWAATQASEISAFYPASAVLIEKKAREHDIRLQIEKSDVAHFATHYVVDERSPMLSMVPLAREENPKSKESDGVLHAVELYNLNLSRLRLVVLSACQTGIEKYYKGEGAIGLARPFQFAGVPLAVASLWPVESYHSTELMERFHKYRKSGGLSTAQALRQAQLDLLKSASAELRNPYNWAAYTVIGGHSNF